MQLNKERYTFVKKKKKKAVTLGGGIDWKETRRNFSGWSRTMSGWRLCGHVCMGKSSLTLQMVMLYVGYDSKLSLKIKSPASLSFFFFFDGVGAPEPVGSLASYVHGDLASCTQPCKDLHSPSPAQAAAPCSPCGSPRVRG